MAIAQVTAMPQDILPVAPIEAKGGEMAPEASGAGGFGRVLQERQASSAQTAAKPAPASSGQMPEGRPAKGVRKGTEQTARRLAQDASEPDTDDEAVAGGRGDQTPKTASAGKGGGSSCGDKTGDPEDDTSKGTVQDGEEPAAALALAGNILPATVDEAAPSQAATAPVEGTPAVGGVAEAAAEAMGSAGWDAPAGGATLAAQTGASGIAVGETGGADDMVATLAVTGRAEEKEPGEVATAGKGSLDHSRAPEKPAREVAAAVEGNTEGKGADAGATGRTAQPEDLHLRQRSASPASGKDEASARLTAASGWAAADGGIPDGATAGPQEKPQQGPATESAGGATEGAQQAPMAPVANDKQEAASAAVAAQGDTSTTAGAGNGATNVEKETAAKGDRKEPRSLEAVHQRQAAAREAAEPGTVTSKAPVEGISDSKTASVADAAQGTGSHAGVGQEGSGGAAGKEEQKPQGKQGEQMAASSLGGVMTAADGSTVESKPTGQKSVLHESILSQVKDGVVTHDGKGNGQVSIRLAPDELGELQIQVRMEDGRVRIEVQAENRMVKDLLMSNLDSLKEALSGKNFTMAGFDVSTGGNSHNSLSGQRGNLQQHPAPGTVRNGYPDTDSSEGRVKYLTADVNNLLDVRF
jgi:flagellar hook-length control protein FliK